MGIEFVGFAGATERRFSRWDVEVAAAGLFEAQVAWSALNARRELSPAFARQAASEDARPL